MAVPPIAVRPGESRDAVTIASYNIRLAQETENKRLDPYTVSAGVKAALDDPMKGLYFVAEIEQRVVGQLMITREWSDWRNGWIWWIQSVYVHAECRGQGVFRALYAHTEQAAREAGTVMLRLYVEHENGKAQAIYSSLGMATTTYGVMEKPLSPE